MNSPIVKAAPIAEDGAPVDVLVPTEIAVPIVLSSPHSGSDYPEDLLSATHLDRLTLRSSEDAFVDDLFGRGIEIGMPMVRARFPRAYLDVNREPYELDPAMFEGDLPGYATTNTAKVSRGLGTIARIVGGGREIYRRKLTFAEAERRVRRCYRPYHRALSRLMEQAHERFGAALLIDCHSMPSIGTTRDSDAGERRADIILGDRHGTSCNQHLMDVAEAILKDLGLACRRNQPYAGGFTTAHYGRPAQGFHAVQVEINRALYMDERRIVPNGDYDAIKAKLSAFLERLAAELSPR